MPRPTQPLPARLDSLTGLRFFAAWMVLQHHFTNFGEIPNLARFTGFGATGVTFFFVLSGFVLTWSRSVGDTAPRFYWRRFARIWPLHAVTTLLALPVMYSMRDVPYEWTGIGLSFLLLHAWVPSATIYFAGNPASWSLSCEAFFYALHPVISRPAGRLGLAAIGIVVSIVLALMATVAHFAIDWPDQFAGWLLYTSPIYRVGEFLLGIGLALAMRRGLRSPIGLIPAGVLLGAWFLFYYKVGPDYLSWGARTWIAVVNYSVLPFIYALVIAAAAGLDLREKRSLLRITPLVRLGEWSYALYLVHAIVIYAAIETIGPRPMAYSNVGWLIAMCAVCIAASAVLYTLVERPAERWLRARTPGRRITVPATVPASSAGRTVPGIAVAAREET